MDNVIKFNRAIANGRPNWSMILMIVSFHLLAIGAFFTFSWTNLAVAIVTWWVAGSLGVGVGYHRLTTHRGFKAPKWLENILAVFATLAVQEGPIAWVTTHRMHHAFVDTEKDPHSPRHGKYWSHMGWLFSGRAQHHSEATRKRYSPDLIKSGFLRGLDKYYMLPTVVLGVIFFAVGGWGMVFWGVFLKTVWGWHVTWMVNSVTHIWGTRRFATNDDSKNNAIVAILTWGEGWHNNHHAYPRSARHGLKWYEFDVNWIQIKTLEKLGLATEIYEFKMDDDVKPMKKAA